MTNKRTPPSPKEYEEAQVSLALSYAPNMYPCADCKWPVIDGYCCTYCGSSSPRRKAGE